MEKLKTEKVEAILENLKEIAIAAKKISADGKVDMNDIAHVMAVLPKVPKFFNDFKEVTGAIEEIKDIDVTEVINLIQKVNAYVKEVEAA